MFLRPAPRRKRRPDATYSLPPSVRRGTARGVRAGPDGGDARHGRSGPARRRPRPWRLPAARSRARAHRTARPGRRGGPRAGRYPRCRRRTVDAGQGELRPRHRRGRHRHPPADDRRLLRADRQRDQDLHGHRAAPTRGRRPGRAGRSDREVRPGGAERPPDHPASTRRDAQRPVPLHRRRRLHPRPAERPGAVLQPARGPHLRLPAPEHLRSGRGLPVLQQQSRPAGPGDREGHRPQARRRPPRAGAPPGRSAPHPVPAGRRVPRAAPERLHRPDAQRRGRGRHRLEPQLGLGGRSDDLGPARPAPLGEGRRHRRTAQPADPGTAPEGAADRPATPAPTTASASSRPTAGSATTARSRATRPLPSTCLRRRPPWSS